jgi:hypothetical protein
LFNPTGYFPGNSRRRQVPELLLDGPDPEFQLIEFESPMKCLGNAIKHGLIQSSPARRHADYFAVRLTSGNFHRVIIDY